MFNNADVEKTQAPKPLDMCERQLKQEAWEASHIGGQAQANRLMSDSQILAELFRYHPANEITIPKFAAINQAAKNFAEVILQNCPPGADRLDAIRKIRGARMTANAAIALNGLNL